MAEMPGYVSADYLRRAAELGRAFKRRTHELLALEPGGAVLDVGCGPATDTLALAGGVGGSGRVVGVDIDQGMVAEADQRAASEGLQGCVSHQVANADALPFPEASFDAVRAERLIQVLPRRDLGARAVAEMHRVLKPGGRAVLADADWGSASVDSGNPALERRLLTFFAESLRPNGYAGRELFRLMHRQGFSALDIEVMPMVHADLSLLPFDNWLPAEALKAGVVSENEAEAWRGELGLRIAAGTFYATVNMVVVSGRK